MRKTNTNQSLDTELNLVPIIDCFVMLICFLLFTAAFTQLVYLEAKITQTTAQAIAKSRDELNKFHLELSVKGKSVVIELNGTDAKRVKETIAPTPEGTHDLQALHDRMIAIKTAHPERFSVDIKVLNSDATKYDELLKIMDAVRHLSEDEFKSVRITGKKLKSIVLTSDEQKWEVANHLETLAQSQLNNPLAAGTDRKLLFPDIALVGVN